MILSQLNYLAIIVASIAYFAVGAVWFNPKVFGAAWMKGHNLAPPTEEDKKGMGKLMGVTFVYCFIATVALACLITIINSTTWILGMKVGLVAGTFSAVSIAMTHMYTKKSFSLSVIDASYHVVGLIIAAIILSLWR